MQPTRFLGASLVLFALCATLPSCNKSDKPSRSTPAYLSDVIDEDQFFRWTPALGDGQIILYIEVDDIDVPVGWNRESNVEAIENARDAWKSAISDEVPIASVTRYLSERPPFDEDVAAIKVRYIDRFSDRTLGEAGPVGVGSSTFDGAAMTLAQKSADGERLTTRRLAAVALHEMGHALGFSRLTPGPSHSNNDGDVMFAELRHDYTSLSAGDAETIRQLYSLTPTHVRVDG